MRLLSTFSNPLLLKPIFSRYSVQSKRLLSSSIISSHPIEMTTVNTTDRLTRLRALMKERHLDVYIVPSEDAHQSEYIAACDARRAFISGFTGSAGTAVITADKAALATDGRYFNQAAKQLDDNWELLKQGMQDVPTWQDWTADQSEGGRTVGVDPTVVTGSDARKLVDKIKKKGGTTLKPVSENLIDLVWGTDKPGRPNEKIKSLDVQFAGKKFEEKLADLRKELEKKKSEGMIVSMLDEIAWLFNLRGNDIDYNPVFFSYALVTATDATLFIDDTKITSEVKAFLGDSVKIKPYSAIFNELKVLKESIESTAKETAPRKKYLISNKASWALSEGLGGEENVEEVRSPIGDSKAVKNSTELEGMRACHIRDGAALSQYFAWLENELINNKASIDEVTAADKLEAIRSKHDRFVGLSFDTISSTGANAAVIHYKPEKGSCATIDLNAIYLCDSGAQYLDGTTDTTRTLHFGNPTEAERESYTLVLKGHIALEQIRFPKGVSGFALDTLARQFLWAQGLDYRHGTGHGVGSYLNVHEGPVGIGTRVQYSEVPLAVGNVLSNEPGFYEDGSYGIRIENIIMVKEVEVKHKWGDKPFLGFEHVTMVPMCRKLTDVSLLSESDKKWLNEYHAEVLEKTQSFFKDDKLTMDWLERETQPY